MPVLSVLTDLSPSAGRALRMAGPSGSIRARIGPQPASASKAVLGPMAREAAVATRPTPLANRNACPAP